MPGEVFQRHTPYSTGQAAEKGGSNHRGNGDGETKEAARARKGREATDGNGGRGERKWTGRQHTNIPTTNDDQRRCATRRGRPDDGTGRGARGGGGKAGVQPDPGGPSSPGDLWILGTRQPWHTLRPRHRKRRGMESMVA